MGYGFPFSKSMNSLDILCIIKASLIVESYAHCKKDKHVHFLSEKFRGEKRVTISQNKVQ